jgi:hypothetical protein
MATSYEQFAKKYAEEKNTSGPNEMRPNSTTRKSKLQFWGGEEITVRLDVPQVPQ